MKRSTTIVLGIASALAVLAIAAGVRRFALPAPPPVLGDVPAFRLVADNGAPFDSASLDGQPWLASFLFTSCPGPCPRLVERLKLVRRSIPAERLVMVSFSVDPVVDTPAVLTAYKATRGISAADRWTFVTGPAEEVLALVRRGFLTGVEVSASPATEGAVVHGLRVALVDGQRHIRGFYSTESDDDLRRLERDVGALP